MSLSGTRIVNVRVTPIAFRDPPLLNVAGVPLPRKRRLFIAHLRRYALVTLIILVIGGFAVSQTLAVIWPPPLIASSAPITPPPRIRLIYSTNWFAIYNPTGRTVSLHGITFEIPPYSDISRVWRRS